MRGAKWLLVATVALVASAPQVGAQRVLEVGKRAKVKIYEAERQVDARLMRRLTLRGEVTAMTADSLFLRLTPHTGVVSLPNADIRRAWVSKGVPSRTESFLIEGIGGAVLLALNAALFYDSGDGYYRFGQDSRGRAAATGAAVGFVAFGAVGLAFPVERWRRARRP